MLKRTSKFLLLDGYFQTCLTQESFENELYILKSCFKYKELSEHDGCVIHVRGGDFAECWQTWGNDKAFYSDAINKMKNEYGVNKFYVVTDDKEYANTVLKDVDFSFVGGGMVEDFYLIGQFKFRILSSSTFALWASVLSANNNGGCVLIPREFTPGVSRNFLLPNESRV